jgi:hypothetical protein
MCLICIDFQRQKMSLGEARRAYGEMVEKIGPEHAREVRTMLDEAEKREAAGGDSQATQTASSGGKP